jgi:hypothetical protein
VCLVAHFGHGFDFPLLRAELDAAGADLQADLLVVDSLEAFRQIFTERSEAEVGSRKKVFYTNSRSPT